MKKKWKKGDASILCSNYNGWVHHNNILKCSKLSYEDFVNHTLNDDLSGDVLTFHTKKNDGLGLTR